MKRALLAVVAIPVVILVICVFGFCFGGLGEAEHLILTSKDFSSPYPVRTPLAAGVILAGMTGIILGLRYLSQGAQRLPIIMRTALTDALLLIAGFGILVGLTFLVLAPFQRSQAMPLLVSGTVLSSLSAALFLSIWRRTHPRPPRSPNRRTDVEARMPIPKEPTRSVAGPRDVA